MRVVSGVIRSKNQTVFGENWDVGVGSRKQKNPYLSEKRSAACTFHGVRIEEKVNQASTAGTTIAFLGLGKASSHFLHKPKPRKAFSVQ